MALRLNRRHFLQGSAGAAVAATGPWYIKDLRAEDPIKIAGIHDGSGGLEIYCLPMIKCLNLAVEEANENGGVLGRPVELLNYDAQSNMQLYTQYATEAATRERVSVVFGGMTSASREVIRPVVGRYQTLYFYNTLYEGGVCDRNIFCTGSTPAQTLEKLVPYIIEKWGPKIYTLAADYNYGQITSKWIEKYALENGGEVVQNDYFPLDVADFGSTVQKIQAAQPDIVMSILVGAAHLGFYRQWAAAGMTSQIPMASTTFGIDNAQVLTTPEEHNGILVSYGYFEKIQTPENQAFVEKYYARYPDGEPLTELAMMTYHGFQLWKKAAEMAGTVDRMPVIEAMETGLSYDGPAGKTTIDPATHHNILDVYIGEAQDSAFEVLESFSQQFPNDTAAVCDLIANPDDNQQYVVEVSG
ncbi:MAG: transporter substrate-binding protein [Alphaproteobacteria bacterium]